MNGEAVAKFISMISHFKSEEDSHKLSRFHLRQVGEFDGRTWQIINGFRVITFKVF